VTTGGAISGYCAIGSGASWRAREHFTEITAAKIS
jgi:hypothetical protein